MRSKHIIRRDFYLVAKFVNEFFMKNSHPNLCWQQLELTISWFLRLLSLPLFDNDFFERSHKYSFKSPADTTRVLMHLNRASDIIIMEINCSLELSDARAALKPQGLLKQLWNCSTQKVLHVKALKINHRCRYFKRHRIFYHDSQPPLGVRRRNLWDNIFHAPLSAHLSLRTFYLVPFISWIEFLRQHFELFQNHRLRSFDLSARISRSRVPSTTRSSEWKVINIKICFHDSEFPWIRLLKSSKAQ